jgi:hypothetical protein
MLFNFTQEELIMSKTVDIQKLKVEIRNALNQQHANVVASGEAKGRPAHLAVGLVSSWGKDKHFTIQLLGYIEGYTEAKGYTTDPEFDLFAVSTEVVKEFVAEWKTQAESELPEELVELIQMLKGIQRATRH